MSEIRIATYNVHSCIGVDRRRSPERIAKVISETNADVVALQEISAHGDIDQLLFIARETGMHAISGPTRGISFGNALLTRFPPREVRRHDLSFPGSEPRGAIDVDLDLDGVVVRVVATHFGLTSRERHHQIDALSKIVGRPEAPLVLLGDFNEWFPRSKLFVRMHADGMPRHPRTFPSWCPVFALDRIWAFPSNLVGQLRAHKSLSARLASDHLPVVADVSFPGHG